MIPIAEVNPQEAWEAMAAQNSSVLVDVRTRPEWAFVGLPDLNSLNRRLLLLEWRQFPDMSVSADFSAHLLKQLDGAVPELLFFLCRSGARSYEAARTFQATLHASGATGKCINVAEGFEGDLDEQNHRGTLNGWKARGLSWSQK